MRHYELVVVLSPMLNQEQVTETWDKIKGFITTREAEISHEEQWGTRRLAYPIRKGQHRFLEGSYHLTRFATERAFNKDLENFLKVDEEILRSLVTVTLPEEELAAQAAAAARAIRTPPPRPAPVGPDGAPIPAAAPAEGAAPADAPAPEASTETPVVEAPAAEASPVAEAAPEPVAEAPEEATAEVETEPAAPEGDDSPAEETVEPAGESDDSEA
ncbi:MAG: 30S ribosomal protein S6 [Chloroflexi bacterium]|nr:30S ribosomal protein S6 [Chloroflexota bacterium]